MAEEQSLDPNRPTEKAVRLVRPSVVVLCGPAACGKSTFAERHFRPTQVISSDWARARVCDDERDQRFSAQAFALVHFLVEQRLSANRLCVVDSTALTPQARRDLLDLARKQQVPCVVLLFDIPLEKCIERDQARERTVGQPVIEHQYQFFERAKASLRQEGFDQVIEVRDEDLSRARVEIIFRPVSRPIRTATRGDDTASRGAPRPAQPVPARPSFMREARPAPPARSSGPAPPPAQPDGRPPASTSGGGSAPAVDSEASAQAAPAPSAAPALASQPQAPSTPPVPPGPSSGEPPGQG